MPLLATATVAPPPPVAIPTEPLRAPPPPAREYVTWTPAGGPTLILSDNVSAGIMLGGLGDDGRSIIGLDMPPQEEHDTQLPGGGELANGRRWAARPVALPVVIHADTLDEEQGLEIFRRRLMASFNPARGDGVLMIAYPKGGRRYLSASYSTGLDVAERGRRGYPYQDSFIVQLKARDPFPYGDQLSIPFNPPENYEFFAPPGDPSAVVYISSSTTSGDSVAVIDGEVDVWPTWTLRGPIATAELRNRDTGKTLKITPNLTAGQTLTIRTNEREPMNRKITRETGVSVWASVVGSANFPVMWPLEPGSNRVSVLLTGTVPGQTAATLTYRPRYLVA